MFCLINVFIIVNGQINRVPESKFISIDFYNWACFLHIKNQIIIYDSVMINSKVKQLSIAYSVYGLKQKCNANSILLLLFAILKNKWGNFIYVNM